MPPKNLQQLNADCVSAAKVTPPTLVHSGNLFRWKGNVTSFLIAEFGYEYIPSFGFVLSDRSASIPCVLINPIAMARKLLDLLHHTVLIRNPQFVAEVVVTDSKQYNLVHVCIESENVHVVDGLSNVIDISSMECNISDENVPCGGFSFVPLKISSIISTLDGEFFCLVLALLLYEDGGNRNEAWLILKNDQVIWKDLLLPNRSYAVHLPVDESLDCIKRYKSLLSVADKHLDLSFQQILHHKELIKTNAAIYLPQNSRLSSSFVNSDTTAEEWFSISDKRLRYLKFASVYGTIKEVQYVESWKMSSCPWCDTCVNYDFEECDDTVANESKGTVGRHEWSMLSVKSAENCVQNERNLPRMKCETSLSDKRIGFGIRGGRVNVQIAVQSISSQELAYVFLKRWTLLQYPAGLMEGLTVCFTDVNTKRSKRKNLYFVATPFTRIVHLETSDQVTCASSTAWGRFGFPNIDNDAEKVWGMLDLDFLAKVTITAKCRLCDQLYLNYRCTNVFCPNNKRKLSDSLYEVTASARLFIRGIEGFEHTSLFLKNDYVQKYLGIPARIWKKLCTLSTRSELLYSYRKNETEFENADPLRIVFHLYCKHFRFKNRFHVSCKKFKGDTSDDRKYFCIDMKEVNDQRLSVTRAAVQACSVKQ